MMKAVVKSLSFSFDNKYLALGSDTLSIHLFHIEPFLQGIYCTWNYLEHYLLDGGIAKIKSFISFKTSEAQDEWEKKIGEKQKITKEQMQEIKKLKKLAMAHSANKTVPMVNFLAVNSKEDSVFELVRIFVDPSAGGSKWEGILLQGSFYQKWA
jgi:hypothetical protein